MKSTTLLAILFLLSPIIICYQCDEDDICANSELPEINFGLLLGGDLKIVDVNNNNQDVTSDYSDFKMSVTKIYCDDSFSGPFITEFTIEDDGVLVKKGIGYWSFKMNNDLDKLKIELFIKDKDSDYYYELNKFNETIIWYDGLKSQDGGNAYVHFTMELHQTISSVSLYSSIHAIN